MRSVQHKVLPMSAFHEELYKYLNPELVSAMGGHKIVLYSSFVAVIEGQKGLKILSSERITFKLKKGFAEIKGNNLVLAVLSRGQAVVTGEIKNIEIIQ